MKSVAFAAIFGKFDRSAHGIYYYRARNAA